MEIYGTGSHNRTFPKTVGSRFQPHGDAADPKLFVAIGLDNFKTSRWVSGGRNIQ